MSERALTSLDHHGKPARALVSERRFDASVEEVWSVLTDPERLPRWFLPVEGELRVGGRYQLVGNAGGTIERCEAPRSLAITWEYGEQTSWLEVDLREDGDRTVLVLRHIAHPDDRWDQYGPGALGIGWDLALLGLGQYLASGEAVDPAAHEAWSASEEGRAFIRASSAAWVEADVADGADPVDAAARGDRTAAAYLGEDQPG